MSEITIGYIKGDELPHSVRLDRDDGKPIYGRGTTLEGAIMRVISLSQMAQLTRYKAVEDAARELIKDPGFHTEDSLRDALSSLDSDAEDSDTFYQAMNDMRPKDG